MKYRYAVDGYNRLIVKRNRKKAVPRGEFSVEKNNRLVYWLNEPSAWRREFSLPNKIKFAGNWKLNANYDLEFQLQENKGQCQGDKLILKGNIISVQADTLAFAVQTLDRGGLLHLQILKLSGVWQADVYNRLSFSVERKTFPDVITLKNAWQINENQKIIYTYEKINLKTRVRSSEVLTFEGFWQIDSAKRITYILQRSLNSFFSFRVQLETPNVYPKKGAIKYRIGIGLSKNKLYQDKIISLYGTWKFNRKLGLVFEIDYGGANFEAIEFGADIDFSKKDKVIFSLVSRERQPLGISVSFSHRFLEKFDAETFLHLKSLKDESAIEAGVKIPF